MLHGDRTLRHHAAVKRKGTAAYSAAKMMPSTKSRWLRSSPETGDCRAISVGMEVALAMDRFKTHTVNWLLFILEHRNQRTIPFPLNPRVAVGSPHLTKTDFRNNMLSSQPLVSLGFTGSVMRDNMVFDSVMMSLEPRAVFSASKWGMSAISLHY